MNPVDPLPAVRRHSATRVIFDLGARGWVSVGLEFVARAAIPASLIASTHGALREAWILALATQALVILRSFSLGRALERELVRCWAQLVDAGGRHSIGFLRARESEMNASLLVFAAQRTAQVRANVAPRLLADGFGLVAVSLAAVGLLGPLWCVAGVAVALVLAPAVIFTASRVRRAEQRGHEELATFVDDCGLLLDGAIELRAHGLSAWAQGQALAHATLVARARRSSTAWRSLLGLFPVAALLLVASIPTLRERLQEGVPAATLVVLGATAVAFALGLVASFEEVLASTPHRTIFERFLDAPVPSGMQLSRAVRAPGWLRNEVVAFDAVSVRHDENHENTPHAFAYDWDPARGLALTGANGAGKSSLVNALFGLVPLASGQIRVGDAPWSEDRAIELRAHVAYVPQRPFLAPSRSVAWHLRLFSEDASDAALEAALVAVGLWPVLLARAPNGPLGVCVGQLSGGELARMHLARVCLPRSGRSPELVVIDEPEAGLDAAGRVLIRELLARIAATTPVLVIAHDDAIVPTSFARASCVRGA